MYAQLPSITRYASIKIRGVIESPNLMNTIVSLKFDLGHLIISKSEDTYAFQDNEEMDLSSIGQFLVKIV